MGSYAIYGGRGVVVCERWRASFQNFLADMGERPEGMTIDRYPDKDGNYEPSNCRWATLKEQPNNRSSNNILTLNGVSRTLTEWSENTGLARATIATRMALGWQLERVLTQPVAVKFRKNQSSPTDNQGSLRP